VRTLVAASLSPGVHAYPWDGRADNGRQVVSGTYFYRLQVDGQQFVRRMNLIK
jgi:flagellar hook assembly protein FlgD